MAEQGISDLTKGREANADSEKKDLGRVYRSIGSVVQGWGEEGQGPAGAIGHWLNVLSVQMGIRTGGDSLALYGDQGYLKSL